MEIVRFNSTEATLSSQLYDEQAPKLNGLVNENYSMEIKGQHQGNNNKRVGNTNESKEEYSTNANRRINAIENELKRAKSLVSAIDDLNSVLDSSEDTDSGTETKTRTKTKASTDQHERNRIDLLLNNANDSGGTNATRLNSGSNVEVKVGTSDDSKNCIRKIERKQKDELESDIGIESGLVEQTESRGVHSGPFNYVNERNLKPFYTHQNRHLVDPTVATTSSSVDIENQEVEIEDGNEMASGDARGTRLPTRKKRSPISAENREDYLKTKELITQRGSRTINNENDDETERAIRGGKGQDLRRDNSQANNEANWHPPMIDDLEEHKMFKSRSKFDSSLHSIDSNSYFRSQDEKEGIDDNDSYIADEIRGDGRSFSFEPVVLGTNLIGSTQEESVTTARTSLLQDPSKLPVQANIRSNDEGITLRAAANENEERHDLLLGDKSQQSLTAASKDIAVTSIRQADRVGENQTKSYFSINKPSVMENLGSRVNSLTRIGNVLNSNVQQIAASGQPNTHISESLLEATSNFNRLDESIMWSAGQYLYMHMKALASSSLFGVEVGVEWSNERSNGSTIDLNVQENPDIHKFASANSHLHYPKIRSPSPFATIDVISGQNLYLQCTGG